ncbi:MAG: cyclic nucleotide-binding domain-containing protein [Chloroflexi bacterium]|nr:cyclic nucleotide-binding domain-containing protein [Chloroflexota bacterium]
MSSESAEKNIESVLKGSLVFSALGEDDLATVASFATGRTYEPGGTVFNEGDKARDILVLTEGRLAVQMALPTPSSQPGRRITVDIIGEKEVFGWSALVEPYVYTLTAVCLQKATVLAIDGDKLRALLQQKADIGYHVLKGLAKVVASRLQDTRQVLISERLLTAGKQESRVRSRASRA